LAEDDSWGDIRSLGATDAGDYSKGRLGIGVAFREPKRRITLNGKRRDQAQMQLRTRTYLEAEKLSPELVREFENRQTEGPQRRTKPNVTNGPVPTVP
jgi:hypothetical protein